MTLAAVAFASAAATSDDVVESPPPPQAASTLAKVRVRAWRRSAGERVGEAEIGMRRMVGEGSQAATAQLRGAATGPCEHL
ncbi:hypothetical protein ASC76_08680 [Rhizobacter sp. Root404]|nr:hypothetical protein ASC76_08680 [Rhizobacter sp. Root404]